MKVRRRVWWDKPPVKEGRGRDARIITPGVGRHEAWGFVAFEKGRQVRRFREEWSKAEAQAEMEAWLSKRHHREYQEEHREDMTFAQAIERYTRAKAGKKSLSYDLLYLKQFSAAFGGQTPVAKITAAKIADWRDAKLAAICARTGRGFAPASVNRPLAALRHLLQLAHEEWGVLAKTPRIKLAQEPEGRIRWLEPQEEAALLTACADSRNKELTNLVTVAMETGLRRGELLSLTWPQVDMTRGFIRLAGADTKSKKGRAVKMRQAVYNVLAGRPGKREGRVWRTRSVRNAFDRAVSKAGLKDFHFHDCRHHFASWFVMRGGQLQALKEILGHADLKMTLRYAHLSPEHLGDEMTRTERGAGAGSPLTQGLTQEAFRSERGVV
jgi:integrase